MPEKTKMADRDKALINILERIGAELQKQGNVLDDIIRSQGELSRTMRSAEFELGTQQNASERSIDKVSETLSHYRSSMLSLVNEQDRINDSLKEMRKALRDTNFALETSNQKIAALEERAKAQDKDMRDYYEHSLKREAATQKGIAENGQTITKLHAGTEKRIGDLHSETKGQIAQFQSDTLRRLLALDGIEAALDTLLIRSEPPEKKPLAIVRIFRKIGIFFRVKLPMLLKKVFILPEWQ